MKSRSREIVCFNVHIDLDSADAEVVVKFRAIKKSNPKYCGLDISNKRLSKTREAQLYNDLAGQVWCDIVAPLNCSRQTKQRNQCCLLCLHSSTTVSNYNQMWELHPRISIEWHVHASVNTLVQIRTSHIFGAKPLSEANARVLLIRSLETKFSEILIKFRKVDLKTSPAKCRPFCFGVYVLINWGLVTPFGDIDLGQHRLWRHQAITWTNVDLSSVRSSCINRRAIW